MCNKDQCKYIYPNLNVCLRPFERREAMADVGLRM